MNLQNINYIFPLRGIAALGVLLVHSTMLIPGFYFSKTSPFILKLFVLGRYGILLFFFISAYTLARSLDIRQESNKTMNYFIRRFFRIAPAYYFVILILMYIRNLDFPYTHFLFINGFNKNTTNSVIGIEWAIFTEFIFYLILPLLVFKFKKYINHIFVFSLLMHITLRELIMPNLDSQNILWLYQSPLYWYFVFVSGVFFYYNKPNINIIKNNPIKTMLAVCIFIAYSAIHPTSITPFVLTILIAITILLLEEYNTKLINNYFFNYIGEISFSIYLIHGPIITQLQQYNLSYPIALFYTLSISIVLASIMYRYIESPGIALGQIIIDKLKFNDNLQKNTLAINIDK